MQKTKEEDFLKLFDRWKEEEKEKLVDEMEKVKEMFMKEFKELTSKNSALEFVSIKATSSQNTGCLERWCYPGILAKGLVGTSPHFGTDALLATGRSSGEDRVSKVSRIMAK
jgi:hypothetical protein